MSRVDFRVYLVTDRHQTGGRPLASVIHQAVSAGIRAVQIRERDLGTRPLMDMAAFLRDQLQPQGVKLLINDRVDLGAVLRLDGAHLRSDSLPVRAARRILPEDALLGCSAHCVDDVVQAEHRGADFVVLGPIYETPSKRAFGAPLGLPVLEEAARRTRVPIFAIGGVTPARVSQILHAGGFGVAVISAVLSASDVPHAARALLDAFPTPLYS
jgi:thiamine-phosphate pyrophosphorylase